MHSETLLPMTQRTFRMWPCFRCPSCFDASGRCLRPRPQRPEAPLTLNLLTAMLAFPLPFCISFLQNCAPTLNYFAVVLPILLYFPFSRSYTSIVAGPGFEHFSFLLALLFAAREPAARTCVLAPRSIS